MYNLNNETKLATRDGFGNAIVDLGKNPNIVVLSAGVGDSTRAYKFKEKFPKRYIESGIAEQSMIGMSCGLALAGKIPFPTSFATFLPGRCYDHIRQSVCYSNLNVKLIATHAGLTVGADGATHQMMEDIAIMRALPNLQIIVPCDSLETEKATKAIVNVNGPFYLRLGREKIPVFTNPDTPFEIGKAVTLKEAKVQLITDSESGVGVVSQITGEKGVLIGDSKGNCFLKYIYATRKIATNVCICRG